MMWSFRKPKPKTCEQCEHYSVYRTEDKLNPDKTVTPGEVKLVACGLWNVELENFDPCQKFEVPRESTRMRKFRGAPAFALYLKRFPLPPNPPMPTQQRR